jgi:hypothetical protein
MEPECEISSHRNYEAAGCKTDDLSRKAAVGADMNSTIEKLVRAEKEMATEKGAFVLFALLLREDAPNVWDLIASSHWIAEDKAAALGYISDRVSSVLEDDELTTLSRVVLIEPDSPSLAVFQQAISVEHGVVEIKDTDFSGLRIKRGYVITSRRAIDSQSSTPTPHVR